MSDVTTTTEAPMMNDPGTRSPTGDIKDQSTAGTTTPTTPASTDGASFLTKPEGDAKPDAKPEDKAPATPGAPETYADFKLPEGFKLDEAASKEVTGIFKDMGLSQDNAQKLIDYYAKNGLQAAEAPYKAWADLQKTWTDEISTRFGSKAEAVRNDISKAIDSTLPPSLARSFRAALDLTGAGSNPDVVEALSLMTKTLLEGTPVVAGSPSKEANRTPGQAPRSVAEAMYPHLIPNRPT